MKTLIMCEGSIEKCLIDMLIANDKTIFSKSELLGEQVFHARQIKDNQSVRFWLDQSETLIKIISIGDTQKDKIKIPNEYKKIITEEPYRYCTKPEIEMLLIISEGLLKEYEKVKSKISPKEFVKKKIKCNKINYSNTQKFYKLYYENRIDLLVSSIKKYKSVHKNKKAEFYLSDLLK